MSAYTRPRDSNPRAAACVVTYLAARSGAAVKRRRCSGDAAAVKRRPVLACVCRLSAHVQLSIGKFVVCKQAQSQAVEIIGR